MSHHTSSTTDSFDLRSLQVALQHKQVTVAKQRPVSSAVASRVDDWTGEFERLDEEHERRPGAGIDGRFGPRFGRSFLKKMLDHAEEQISDRLERG